MFDIQGGKIKLST